MERKQTIKNLVKELRTWLVQAQYSESYLNRYDSVTK